MNFSLASFRLSRADLVGIDGYTFTEKFLGWVAEKAGNGGLLKTGVLGPIEAFGLETLREGCEQSGLKAMIK